MPDGLKYHATKFHDTFKIISNPEEFTWDQIVEANIQYEEYKRILSERYDEKDVAEELDRQGFYI